MGVVKTTLARIALYALAILVNVAASLLIVRRLPYSDYAVYQTIVKRVAQYAARGLGLYAGWAYRYYVSGISGTLSASLLIGAVFGLGGGIAGYYAAVVLGAETTIGVLAGWASGLIVVWQIERLLVDARHPVKSSLLVLAQRLAFSAPILAVVYLLGYRVDLVLVFSSAILSYAIASLASLYLLRERWSPLRLELKQAARLIVEWSKRLYATLVANIASIVMNLDVVVAYTMSSSRVVAAFFATTNILSLVAETGRASFLYLHGFVLATRDYGSAIRALKTSALIAAIILFYAASLPQHFIYLVNPLYSWASQAVPLAAAATYLVLIGNGLQNILRGLVREDTEAARRLAVINSIVLVSSLAYLAVVASSLAVLGGEGEEIVGWALGLLVFGATNAGLAILILERSKILTAKNVSQLILLYPFASLVSALLSRQVLPPSPPSSSFWATALSLLPPLAIHTALSSTIIILADREIRAIVKRSLQLLPSIF